MLDLFNRYDAPATWAVVGHLMLNSCDGSHTSLPRPDGQLGHRWYDEDPGTDSDDAPLYYAPDLVEAIASTEISHELGCHTFSHLLCSEASEVVLNAELEQCRTLLQSHGQELQSLVYPRNELAHLDTVADAGIKVIRDVSSEYILRHRRVGGRYRRYARFITRRPYTPVVPEPIQEDCWRLPASMYLPFNPLSPTVNDMFATHPRVVRAQKSIDAAARESGIFHVWAHPQNFDDRLFRDLESILAYANRQEVPVLTMHEATRRYVGE
ncbi:polysaccharide deacetylase family protein [Halomicroarcula sp. GCM10025743]|uniref:polysaccharide deacetylase family protein n=1 Tax=Halomicroarcula sp. GCM10025743 TaxID=3252671 RepID=UPI0036D23B8A